ncbi:hypothetical protein UO65_1449 [Actinokineospora spheciospongiae]|uniref:Uncharacterized protein n=1 Tax=Actinokineospora spheciospongiae TaxID=909613 RepID=W7IQT2_9PSEU|nr:hypothetical protein [Actinokineospora spheciospongiae]EWC63235.1 hypothetical protein UO65_1449 [Actinokineospora spheciospongiae]
MDGGAGDRQGGGAVTGSDEAARDLITSRVGPQVTATARRSSSTL